MILLTPGPCMTTDSVRAAASLPDLNHREPEFSDLFASVRSELLSVYGLTDWNAFLLGGSGTAAVEAMVTSCVVSGPVLVVENGYYSERIAEILEVHGIPHERLTMPWEEPMDISAISVALEARQFEAVLMTHQETTLGLLNPIQAVGALCQAHGVTLLVDAMSSFGGDPLDFTNCSAVCASANKCLRGLPGVGFVLVREDLVARMASVRRRSYYLHLPMYAGDSPAVTPPVPMLRSLNQALVEFPGLAVRVAENVAMGVFVRARLGELGVGWFEPGELSNSTLSIELARLGPFEEFYSFCHSRGFAVYGCKKHLRERYFQISWMGAVSRGDLEGWFSVVSDRLGGQRP